VALDPAVESAIERAVARQIRPLREQLVAAEDRIRLQDILGGIGYIIGLTGLALWWRSRRRSGPT
jgi:nickel transport protein